MNGKRMWFLEGDSTDYPASVKYFKKNTEYYLQNMKAIIDLLARYSCRSEGGSYFSKACLTKLSQRSQVFKEEFGVLPSEYPVEKS